MIILIFMGVECSEIARDGYILPASNEIKRNCVLWAWPTSSTTLCMRSRSPRYRVTCSSSRNTCRAAVEAWQACATTAPTGQFNVRRRSPRSAMYWTKCEAPCLDAITRREGDGRSATSIYLKVTIICGY